MFPPYQCAFLQKDSEERPALMFGIVVTAIKSGHTRAKKVWLMKANWLDEGVYTQVNKRVAKGLGRFQLLAQNAQRHSSSVWIGPPAHGAAQPLLNLPCRPGERLCKHYRRPG